MRLHFKGLMGAALFTVLSAGAVAPEKQHSNPKPNPRQHASPFGEIQVTKLIVMPDSAGHTDWVDAINSAKSSVHMTMYHLTDTAVVDAVISKAKDKKFDLKILVDSKLSGGFKTVFSQMQSAGVQIRAASPGFSLTHSKDMVVDGKIAFISAINMTNTAANTRDFGIITPDQSIIAEIESVFAADWENAQTKGTTTPTLSNPNLAWSPTNSDARLVALIDSAQSTLVAETESFDDTDIINALNRAADRKVNVRLIVPECNLGSGLFNYPYLAQLKNVNVHVEHDGNSVQQPYMHSKMMLIDDHVIYIGSINYTVNSIQNDRELGAIFTNSEISKLLSVEFETDWNRSQMPAAKPNCSSSSSFAPKY